MTKGSLSRVVEFRKKIQRGGAGGRNLTGHVIQYQPVTIFQPETRVSYDIASFRGVWYEAVAARMAATLAAVQAAHNAGYGRAVVAALLEGCD